MSEPPVANTLILSLVAEVPLKSMPFVPPTDVMVTPPVVSSISISPETVVAARLVASISRRLSTPAPSAMPLTAISSTLCAVIPLPAASPPSMMAPVVPPVSRDTVAVLAAADAAVSMSMTVMLPSALTSTSPSLVLISVNVSALVSFTVSETPAVAPEKSARRSAMFVFSVVLLAVLDTTESMLAVKGPRSYPEVSLTSAPFSKRLTVAPTFKPASGMVSVLAAIKPMPSPAVVLNTNVTAPKSRSPAPFCRMASLVPPGVSVMVPVGVELPISRLISPFVVVAVILLITVTSMGSPNPAKKSVTVPISPSAVRLSTPALIFKPPALPSMMSLSESTVTVLSAPLAPPPAPKPPRAINVPFRVMSAVAVLVTSIAPAPPPIAASSPSKLEALPPEVLILETVTAPAPASISTVAPLPPIRPEPLSIPSEPALPPWAVMVAPVAVTAPPAFMSIVPALNPLVFAKPLAPLEFTVPVRVMSLPAPTVSSDILPPLTEAVESWVSMVKPPSEKSPKTLREIPPP